MNLSFTVGDEPENVVRNYEIMAEAFDIPVGEMVYAHQTHTANVLSVNAGHGGMGIIRERSFHDVDAIVTDEPEVCLVTGHADCVPIYFVDTKQKVIALAHAGWRGTVGNIVGNTIAVMCEKHKASTENIVTCIGPCICKDCYEIGEDVADIVRESFRKDDIAKILFPRKKTRGKYLLDLRMANEINLKSAGIRADHIFHSGHCTCCESDIFHSHRATKGHRGGNSAFLMMRG